MKKLCRLPIAHLVGPHLETLQRIGAEGAADGNIGGVAATGNQHTPDTWDIVSSIKGVPLAIKVGLKPTGKIHRAIGRWHTDVAQVSGTVSSRDVHATTESDGEVRVITANAGFLLESLPGRFGATRVFVAK